MVCLIYWFIFFSCTKDKEYKIVVQNNTDYRIDRMEVYDTELSIMPNSRSATYYLIVERSFAVLFTQPFISVSILKYSNGDVSFDHKRGSLLSEEGFSFRKLNVINVSKEFDNEGEMHFRYKLSHEK